MHCFLLSLEGIKKKNPTDEEHKNYFETEYHRKIIFHLKMSVWKKKPTKKKQTKYISFGVQFF